MPLDLETRCTMAFVQERLLRDMHNARHALQHSPDALADAPFTLALLSAAAEFALDQVQPGADLAEAVPAVVDVFRQELEKLAALRGRAQLKGGA